MKRYRRWLSLALSALLAVITVTPGYAAEDSIASFRIDAAALDFPQQTLSIQTYRRDSAGHFQADGFLQLDCTLNRVTGDASFYIQPATDGVQVTVDYLTDLDNNGVYELLDGGGTPAWQVLAPQPSTVLLPAAQAQSLNAQQTYILSAQTLSQGFSQAVQDRSQAGSASYLGLTAAGSAQSFPLCLVSLRRSDANGQERVQSYYLRLYDRVLLPLDVSPSDPCYRAVSYVLSQGYFSGTGNGLFQPDAPFTRAQLAQILWRLGGSLAAPGASFSDVSPDDWYYEAVSWCCSRGVMAGLPGQVFAPDEPLTREQLSLILYQYTRLSGANVSYRVDLSVFSDGGAVSPWAQRSMEWAMAHELLTCDENNAIHPGANVTRGQMAMVLYTYDRLLIF